MEMFPRKGSGRFRRIDLEGDEWERSMRTLEALASGYTHITNAVFATEELSLIHISEPTRPY